LTLILNPIRYVICYEKIDPLPSKWNCINFNVGRGVRLGFGVVEWLSGWLTLILNPIRYVIYYEKIDPLPSKWNCINFNVGRGVRLGFGVVEWLSGWLETSSTKTTNILYMLYIIFSVHVYMYMSLINL
jgi:hypothetical protein